MHIDINYHIMKPLQLPWMNVTPADLKGLDYHITKDLHLKLNGIISGDQEFVISHVLLALEEVEVNELEAEHIFTSEILPAKSQERITKSLKDQQFSCFFNQKQMDYLHKLFEEKNFMCSDVTVWYKGRKVDDIAQLPEKEHQLTLDIFEELEVIGGFDHKVNKEDFLSHYQEARKEKVAEMDETIRKSKWDRVTNKDFRKKAGKAFVSAFVGIGCMVLRTRLSMKGGIWTGALAIIAGIVGIGLEFHSREEMHHLLKILKSHDKTERVFQ